MSGLVVMPSNNTGHVVRSLAERFPGRLAHLISPGGWRRPFLPYALDNGAFGAYRNGTPFDSDAFMGLILKVQARQIDGESAPCWLVVPDVVADKSGTLAAWRFWMPQIRGFGWPLAFVVQDGMEPSDVPEGADVVFVGGSLPWKWSTVPMWADAFGPRVHVGRVNSPTALDWLQELGVGSCDGTGWLRGDPVQLQGLVRFLEGAGNLRLFDAEEWVETSRGVA